MRGAEMKVVRLALLLAVGSMAWSQVIGFVGDSITYNPLGVAAALSTLNTLRPDLTFTDVNRGLAGTTTAQWVATHIGPAVTAFTGAGVTVVFIMLGTNDANVANSVAQATYSANIASLIATIKAAGINRIILNYQPYINTDTTWNIVSSNALLVQYQSALVALAAADPSHVFMGDTTAYSFFQTFTGLLSDGVHPTTSGYASLGGFWGQAYYDKFLCTVTTASLPGGKFVAYSQTPVTNCLSPTWSVATGALPTGLSINSSSGAITGTPTLAGSYSFSLQVLPNAATKALSIEIGAARLLFKGGVRFSGGVASR